MVEKCYEGRATELDNVGSHYLGSDAIGTAMYQEVSVENGRYVKRFIHYPKTPMRFRPLGKDVDVTSVSELISSGIQVSPDAVAMQWGPRAGEEYIAAIQQKLIEESPTVMESGISANINIG